MYFIVPTGRINHNVLNVIESNRSKVEEAMREGGFKHIPQWEVVTGESPHIRIDADTRYQAESTRLFIVAAGLLKSFACHPRYRLDLRRALLYISQSKVIPRYR